MPWGTSAGLVDRALTATPAALSDSASADALADTLTVALHGRELVLARAGSRARLLGLAIDLGTTSLAAALVSLDDGSVVVSASSLNPQVGFARRTSSRGSGTRSTFRTAAHTWPEPFATGSRC